MKGKTLKLFSLLACLTLSAGFVACGGAGDGDNGNSTSESSSVSIGAESDSNENSSVSESVEIDNSESSGVGESSSVSDGAESSSSQEGGNQEEEVILEGTEGVQYDLLAGGTCASVLRYEGDATKVVIASRYQGVPVKYIERGAFGYNENITEIVIPDSITYIGDRAFSGCEKLTKAVIGKGVTSIGVEAFFDCALTEILLSDGVTDIGRMAFSGCPLTQFVLPDSVRSIGYNNFYKSEALQCNVKNGLKYLGNENNPYLYLVDVESTGITSAVVENGCKFIGNATFLECAALTEVVLPDSIVNVESAFGACENLQYTVVDGLKYVGNKTNPYLCLVDVVDVAMTEANIKSGCKVIGEQVFMRNHELGKVTIPDTVTHIGNWAFNGCALTELTIPDSVISIGYSAFLACRASEIFIPDSVEYIGEKAFSDCANLTKITVDENSKAYQSIDGNLYSKDGKVFLQYASGKTDTSFVVPDGVEELNIDMLTMPARLATTSEYITELVIPDSVVIVHRDYAGGHPSYSLRKVTCPASVIRYLDTGWITHVSVTSGEMKDEYWGTVLPELVVSERVTYIEEGTLLMPARCSKTTVIVDEKNPYYQIIDGNLYTKDGKTLLLYLANGVNSLTIPSSVTHIGAYAFKAAWYHPTTCAYGTLEELTSINIGDKVVSMPSDIFADCPNLQSINVDASNPVYKSIDGNLYTDDGKTLVRYANGKEDSTFTLPDGVKKIGEEAFSYSNLTEIIIPDGVTNIGMGAFKCCEELEKLVISDSVTDIGAGMLNKYAINKLVTIYCEAECKPDTWAENWNEMVFLLMPNRTKTCPVYWYSEDEPALNGDGTAYDGNYWHYGENGEIIVWTRISPKNNLGWLSTFW